jgi:bifunctional DNA-binding transcriptional regulator/antitoxin component of YhaV-PrlF toxin-antitoxin module
VNKENKALKALGTSKISYRLRITLPRDVADVLKADDGDFVMFYKNEHEEIVLKKA